MEAWHVMDFRKKLCAAIDSPGFAKLDPFGTKFEPFFAHEFGGYAFFRGFYEVRNSHLDKKTRFLRGAHIAANKIAYTIPPKFPPNSLKLRRIFRRFFRKFLLNFREQA